MHPLCQESIDCFSQLFTAPGSVIAGIVNLAYQYQIIHQGIVIQFDDIIISHPNTAVRDWLANAFFIRGSMNIDVA